MQWKPYKTQQITFQNIFSCTGSLTVFHNGIIKSNIWQYNLTCYCEGEKQCHPLQKKQFLNHCNFRLPQQHIKTIKWQTIVTLLWKLLSIKCGLYNALLYIKSNSMALLIQRLSLTGDKAVTGMKCFKLLFAPTFDPWTQDGLS